MLSADALAARVAGGESLAEGLTRTHAAVGAFEAYWVNELAPVLDEGFLPPIGDGFALFVSAPRVSEQLAQSLNSEMQKAEPSDPHGTHPTLRERLAALGYNATPSAADGPRAAILLRDEEQLERQLLARALRRQDVELRRVDWDNVVPCATVAEDRGREHPSTLEATPGDAA